jgi:hypothetical protein
MSGHPIEEELAKLEREVRALSKDASAKANTIRDEAVAAEYIATEETLENVGTVMDAFMRLNEIQRKFWETFFADQRQTFEAITGSRSPGDFLRASIDHCSRRAEHDADAFRQTFNVLTSGARSVGNTFNELWKPFGELVRRDARG